jgi:1-aminocyclopropane-1-carboxylate deaminase/D-cysteine desulfhydrase-like pyridoxal-dependent ACC family enzyme
VTTVNKLKNVSERSVVSRVVAVIVVVAAASGSTALVAAALASSGHSGKRIGLSIFSHPRKRLAHVSSAGRINPPPGAVLGTVREGIEVYAWQPSPGEVCVMNIKIGGQGGAACGLSSQVEEEGVVGIHYEGEGSGAALRVAALLPNSVKSVVFTDRDGSSSTVDVTNNTVADEDPNLVSMSYVLPDGADHTVNIAAVTERRAKRPTALPGSSN